ncbi:MAG: hypothetical protein K2O14_04320 [Oscillospiraceae bacterium]|nr:hypothetical protein [Oscillospiraceae bacterium]
MTKVFGYELKRMLTSGLFIAMLAVNAVFAWYVLTTEVIEGIAYTAPFSVWSSCAFIGKTLPLAVITVLLLQAGYYGKQQKRVEIITSAAPMTYAQTMMIRTSVLGICFLVICLVDSLLGAVFFAAFFGYYGFGAFILPALLEIIPCFVFTVGIGHLAGRLHCSLIYALLPAVFIAGFIGASGAFDLFGGGFFSAYPLTLPIGADGEPGFVLNSAWLIARFIYLAAGAIILIANSAFHPKIKRA